MKRQASKKVRREIFVLTPEEKRTVCFVLVAFVLGLATQHYRATHSVTPLTRAVNETATTADHRAEKPAEAKRSRPK